MKIIKKKTIEGNDLWIHPLRALKRADCRVSFFGVWCSQTWMFFVSQTPHHEAASLSYNLYPFILFPLATVAVVYALRKPSDDNRKLDWPLAFIMSLGTLCVFSSEASQLSFLRIIGYSACGVGVAWAYLGWILFYSKLDVRSSIGFLFTACIIGSVVKLCVSFLPLTIIGIICAALPFVSVVFLHRSFRSLPQKTSSKRPYYQTNREYSALWKAALCVFSFTFVCTCVNAFCKIGSFGGTIDLPPSGLGKIVEIIICLVVLFIVFVANGTFGFMQLWGTVALLVSAPLVMLMFEYDLALSRALTGVAIDLIVAYYWLALADVSHHAKIHPYLIFSIGWSVYVVPRFLGDVAMRAISLDSLGISHMQASGLLLFGVVLITVICLLSRNPYIQRIFSDLDDTDRSPEEFKTIDKQCASLAEHYSLTPREVEIMQMLCKGRSRAYIAETLFISENTVKGHCARLYAKMGVHTKQELQETVGI